jgi:hypothetical protein
VTISTTSDPEVNDFPRLTRFYGLSFLDLCSMPRWARLLYVDALPALEAEEQLAAMQAAEYPHVDEKSRKKIHRAVVGRIEGSPGAPAAPSAPPIDVRTDGNKLAGIGIALVVEPPAEKEEVTADA